MADSTKEYAWYIEGNEIAIIEKDVNFDNNVDNKEFGPGTSRQLWKSPQSDVADGLEIKYVYSPNHWINTPTYDATINGYAGGANNKLRVGDYTSSYTNFVTAYSLAVGDYFVIKKAGQFNGLHKITAFESLTGTNNLIVTDTDYSHLSTPSSFEETVMMYYNVSALEDESFELDLPIYLQKALVYYVKGKLAEDAGNLELRQYAMREFKKMIEKHENSRISGLRIMSPGSHAIR